MEETENTGDVAVRMPFNPLDYLTENKSTLTKNFYDPHGETLVAIVTGFNPKKDAMSSFSIWCLIGQFSDKRTAKSGWKTIKGGKAVSMPIKYITKKTTELEKNLLKQYENILPQTIELEAFTVQSISCFESSSKIFKRGDIVFIRGLIAKGSLKDNTPRVFFNASSIDMYDDHDSITLYRLFHKSNVPVVVPQYPTQFISGAEDYELYIDTLYEQKKDDPLSITKESSIKIENLSIKTNRSLETVILICDTSKKQKVILHILAVEQTLWPFYIQDLEVWKSVIQANYKYINFGMVLKTDYEKSKTYQSNQSNIADRDGDTAWTIKCFAQTIMFDAIECYKKIGIPVTGPYAKALIKLNKNRITTDYDYNQNSSVINMMECKSSIDDLCGEGEVPEFRVLTNFPLLESDISVLSKLTPQEGDALMKATMAGKPVTGFKEGHIIYSIVLRSSSDFRFTILALFPNRVERKIKNESHLNAKMIYRSFDVLIPNSDEGEAANKGEGQGKGEGEGEGEGEGADSVKQDEDLNKNDGMNIEEKGEEKTKEESEEEEIITSFQDEEQIRRYKKTKKRTNKETNDDDKENEEPTSIKKKRNLHYNKKALEGKKKE
jgi:hypothetical protein